MSVCTCKRCGCHFANLETAACPGCVTALEREVERLNGALADVTKERDEAREQCAWWHKLGEDMTGKRFIATSELLPLAEQTWEKASDELRGGHCIRQNGQSKCERLETYAVELKEVGARLTAALAATMTQCTPGGVPYDRAKDAIKEWRRASKRGPEIVGSLEIGPQLSELCPGARIRYIDAPGVDLNGKTGTVHRQGGDPDVWMVRVDDYPNPNEGQEGCFGARREWVEILSLPREGIHD